jgi:hypothetical protein
MTGETILVVLGAGTALGVLSCGAFAWSRGRVSVRTTPNGPVLRARLRALKAAWRMPPLEELSPPGLSLSHRIWMGVLRLYLIAAIILVAVKVAEMAVGR